MLRSRSKHSSTKRCVSAAEAVLERHPPGRDCCAESRRSLHRRAHKRSGLVLRHGGSPLSEAGEIHLTLRWNLVLTPRNRVALVFVLPNLSPAICLSPGTQGAAGCLRYMTRWGWRMFGALKAHGTRRYGSVLAQRLLVTCTCHVVRKGNESKPTNRSSEYGRRPDH